ncbi:Chaperonin CPN60-2, mitochondrial [Capsicum chinense]|nr:Chaperonin CPN60-2, mitochondrial [Capsicum chinense]
MQIIQNTLKISLHTITSNSGVEGSVVVGKLLKQNNPDLGYDATKGKYVDMVKARFIDPLKVIRIILVDAASVSYLLTTTEAIIVEQPKDEKASLAMLDGVAGDNAVIEEKEKELVLETITIEAPPKEEVENVEREIKDVKTVGQDEDEEKSIVNEELAAPKSKGFETFEVTEKVPELEIASRDIKPITENGSELQKSVQLYLL